jgi:hypothetical protein
MYNFEIVFEKHKRTSPTLQDIQSIYVSGICICAKNNKFGKFYFNERYIKNVSGKFYHVAGSVRYPILFPQSDKVVISVRDFPRKPDLQKDDLDTQYKPFIYLQNITNHP